MDTQADVDAKAKQQASDTRCAEIMARLSAIDVAKIRPLSAVALGKDKQEDKKRLTELETEAEALRNELKTI